MIEDIRDRIGKVREHAKKSQEEFGAILGVTKSTISLLETKKREPSERLLRDICREFNVNEVCCVLVNVEPIVCLQNLIPLIGTLLI